MNTNTNPAGKPEPSSTTASTPDAQPVQEGHAQTLTPYAGALREAEAEPAIMAKDADELINLIDHS